MHEADIADWDKLPSGHLDLSLVEGFEIGAAPGFVLVRLAIQVGPGQTRIAQLAFPAEAAALLAKEMTALARRSRTSASKRGR